MVEGRKCCKFRLYCAAHVPTATRYTSPAPIAVLPTHSDPAGQVHVPRVWEVTGAMPNDRKRAVREWNRVKDQLENVHAGKATRKFLRLQSRSV